MTVVRDPGKVEDSLRAYHTELVAAIIGEIETGSVGRVVELGSGTGLFTVPLIEALRDRLEVLYCVDPFPGPYRASRTVLEARLASLDLGKRVEILEVDATEVGGMICDIDLVAGHEMLCDLDVETVRGVLRAAHNMLVDGGRFVHAEFSPHAANRAQRLLHDVNDHAEQPISNATWFSPGADELAGIAHDVGFGSIHVDYVRIPIRFESEAALELLKWWGPLGSFYDRYREEILEVGVEFPLEQVLHCLK